MSSSPHLTAQQNAQFQEVADMLLEIYDTLAELRYVDPESIVRGPHDLSNLQDLYTEHKLDPSIRHLYTLIPYIDERETEARDFFHGGTFFNPTNEGDVEQGHDPFYASPEGQDYEAEGGPYMKPWFTALSNMGNHQSVILYDAKMHRIWIVDQEGWGTTDPGLRAEYRKFIGDESEKSDWGDDSSEGVYEEKQEESSDDDSSSHGSSEFWSDTEDDEDNVDEFEQLREERAEPIDFDEGFEVLGEDDRREARDADVSPNSNSFEHIDSRDAGDVLRDINRYYRELKIMPAQGEYNHEQWDLPKEVLKPLYLKHGWPDSFDGEAFEIDQIRAHAASRAKYGAEDPLRQVECHAGWIKYCDNDISRCTKDLKEAKAKGVDDEWLARFNLWLAEQRKLRNLNDLKERKEDAERLCPGGICQREEDLPLWEMEWLRVQRHREVERYEGEAEKEFHARKRQQNHKAAIHRLALDAAQANVARLCPGRTFEEATGRKALGGPGIRERIKTSKYWQEFSRKEVEKLRKWAEQLPEEAASAREKVHEEVEKNEKGLEKGVEEVERMERWIDEHGEDE